MRRLIKILEEEEKLSLLQLKELINISSKIALLLLSNNYRNEISRFSFLSISIQDLAIDAVATLFVKDKSGELPLKKALNNWSQEINDDTAANYFLSKIIGNRIEQEIAKKLKEADPFFGKILRSFNHLVNTNRIKKTMWFGTLYIIENETETIKQKPIEPDVLENLPSSLFQGTNQTIICALFNYLKSETNFFPAIPLNALIRKIKHVNGSFLQLEIQNSFAAGVEETINIDRIMSESLNCVQDRLDKFYLGKGKFNINEAEVFRNVLYELATDMKDGGISRGLYEYLKSHINDLTKEVFYKKYHQPLDYLLRLLKKEIAERLESSG